MVTKTKNEQNKQPPSRRPAREFRASLSKNGKYWLLRDTTTWFIPVNYLAAIQSAFGKAQAVTIKPVDEGNGGENGGSR